MQFMTVCSSASIKDIYNGLTPEQQAVVDECGQKAVEYERYINRSSDNEIKERWAIQKRRNLHRES